MWADNNFQRTDSSLRAEQAGPSAEVPSSIVHKRSGLEVNRKERLKSTVALDFTDTKVSICIPVYNEANSIEVMYQQIAATDLWQQASEREIVFCLNGCTDHSERVAKKLALEHPDVSVVIADRKGKNNAWKECVSESSSESEYIFFLDADVRIGSETLSVLLEELATKPDISIVGAEAQPLQEEFSSTSVFRRLYLNWHYGEKTLERRKSLRMGLCGQCYVIKREAAISFKMTEDERIMDDVFLQGSFGDAVRITSRAKVYSRVPSFLDRVRQEVRYAANFQVLQDRYSDVSEKYMDSVAPKKELSPRWEYFLSLPLNQKAGLLLYKVALKLGRVASKLALKYNLDTWGKVESTKFE